MSIASFFLVVLAAFCHATWNLLSKRAAFAGATFVFCYNFVACVAYAPWVFWLLAHGKFNFSWAAALDRFVEGTSPHTHYGPAARIRRRTATHRPSAQIELR